MPSFDGTGPQGKGPMTGRGLGYCVLQESADGSGRFEGLAGVEGVPVGETNRNDANQEKEVIQMPFGDGTGPAGMGPMTGRGAGFCAGYPVSGRMNPVGFVGRRAMPYGRPMYGVGTGYAAGRFGWFGRWLRGGFGQKGRTSWDKEMVEDAWVVRTPPGRAATVSAPNAGTRCPTRPDSRVRKRTARNAAHR